MWLTGGSAGSRNKFLREGERSRPGCRTGHPRAGHFFVKPEMAVRYSPKPTTRASLAAPKGGRAPHYRARLVTTILPMSEITSHAGPGNLCICTSTSSNDLRNQSTSFSLITSGGSSLTTSML